MKENNFDPRCHIGETHGIYTIIDMLDKKDKYGHYIYVGECNECGYKKYSHYGSFTSKSQKNSCNHIVLGNKYIQQIRWKNGRIKSIFHGMKLRCYNKQEKDYRWYGEKGIKICSEWLNNPLLFEEWSLQNGYNDNLTIDRINEDMDYSPDNCRWIPSKNNSKYKSTTFLINVDGEVHTGREWSKILKLGINRINTYIGKYGMESTIEFIRRFIKNPNKKPKGKQSYFNLYMNV